MSRRVLPNACPDCGKDMVLKNSRYGLFYGCVDFPDCRSTHGAHPDGSPLGIPANKETKLLRIAAHNAFDCLWQSGSMRRKDAYRWLMRAMRMSHQEAHFGRFTAEQCRRAIAALGTRDVLPRRYGTWEYIAMEVAG